MSITIQTNVLVGGKDPDKVYNDAAERTRRHNEEREALERQQQEAERERQARQPAPAGDGAEKASTATSKASSKPLFTLENIVPDGRGGYVFEGLETPMGRWDFITLDAQLAEKGEKRNWAYWVQLNQNKKDDDRFRIMPARVRYWLMAAAYESRDTWNKMLGARIGEVNEIFWGDMTSLCHNAEKITYLFTPPAQTGGMALAANFGWPNNHPFTLIERPYFLNSSPAHVGKDDRASDLLKTLFNDPDPAHVRDVLQWVDLANGQDYMAYMPPDSNTKSTHVTIGYMSPADRKLPAINTLISCDAQLHCRYIRADPKDYHPRHGSSRAGGTRA